MKRFTMGTIAAVGMLFVLLTVSAYARIPLPSDVPNSIPEPERSALKRQRAELFKRRDALKERVEVHNKRSRNIPADSPLVEEYRQAQKALQSEIDNYAADVREFNTSVVEAGASIPLLEDSQFPEIDKLLLGVQRIRVPPPVPPQDAVIESGQLAPGDKAGKKVILGLEAGVAVMDIVGKLGNAALPAKLILVTGKSFIAAEDAADVYLVKQTELYKQASAYLKDQRTRLRFTEIVRAIKVREPVPENADVQMLRAAHAILDPKLGNSGMRTAWDAMFSPGARRAALSQAYIELGGRILGVSAAKGGPAAARIAKRITAVHKPAFAKAAGTVTNARKMLEKVKNAEAKAKLYEVIKEANKKMAETYRISSPGKAAEKTAEWSLDMIFKHAEEDLREKGDR